jgi:hypothetical protein
MLFKITFFAAAALSSLAASTLAGPLECGTAKVEITDRDAGPVNDPAFAKALVLRKDGITTVILTLDAVAVGEIGRVPANFLPKLREKLNSDFNIQPAHVLVTASHCHAIVKPDLLTLALAAVREAVSQMAPSKAGMGVAYENRISENRRFTLLDGSEADMRRAYSMPKDGDVARVGPIDPEVGILKIEKPDGTPLAVVYNFACHPIMNPPSKGNSADFPGFSSKLIEDTLGHGAMAFFIQGCAGDINPIRYKDATSTPDAEPLGLMLAGSVIKSLHAIQTQSNPTLEMSTRQLRVPAAKNYDTRINLIETERQSLLNSLRPTNINFKSFLPLFIQHGIWPDAPSRHIQSYLHDQSQGRAPLKQQDADNKKAIESYLSNIEAMEKLTRLNTNLALLKKHQKHVQSLPERSLAAEICSLRVGEFRLITFPGELTVGVGLEIKKKAAPKQVFVAGYTNGYLYYAPTAAQLQNTGYAQEDCDTLLAPEWHTQFEASALEIIGGL